MFKRMNYDNYHSNRSVSRVLITDTNFTYINLIKRVKPLILSGGNNILDLGCGVGTLSNYIASKGNKVLGVDISPKAIRVARESSHIIGNEKNTKFIIQDIENLDTNETFDLIILSEVLEHVHDDRKLIRKLIKYLKKDGYLFISTPSLNAPLYKFRLLDKFDKEVGHLRRYSFNTLIQKLPEKDLKILNKFACEGILRNALFTNKLLGSLVRFLKGPIGQFVNYIDSLTVSILGESQLIILCKKL